MFGSKERTIEYYKNDFGVRPYIKWKESLVLQHQLELDDLETKIERGQMQNPKVGKGSGELRYFKKSGNSLPYRLYNYEQNKTVIHMLLGGSLNKKLQSKDIKTARKYLKTLLERLENGN